MNFFVNFIVSVTKCLTKAVEGRKASSGSQFEGTVRRDRKSGQWGCEAAGPVASSQEAESDECLCSAFSYLVLDPSPWGWWRPHSGWIFPSQPHLESPSQACPVVCSHDDSKSLPSWQD